MIRNIFRTFIEIYTVWRIPRLPRMFASPYEHIPPDVVDVMRRLGCRDPRGVQIAMRRHGVATVPELIAILEYQQPRRNILRRLWLAVGRTVGESDTPLHRDEIMQGTRNTTRTRARAEIAERVRTAVHTFVNHADIIDTD